VPTDAVGWPKAGSCVVSAWRAAGRLALGLSGVRRDNRTFAEVRTDD